MTSDEIRRHLEMLLADGQVLHRKIELLYEETTKLFEIAKQQTAEAKERTAEAREHTAQLKEHTAQLRIDDGRIAALVQAAQADGENIRALARIAETHQHRLDRIEGTDDGG